MAYLYWLPHDHKKLFGTDEPQSFEEVMKVVFSEEDHQVVRAFDTAWEHTTEEGKKRIKKQFITDMPLSSLGGFSDEIEMKAYPGQKHQRLIESIKKEGIKVPCLVIISEDYPFGHVIEGHHRSGAAAILGMKTIPAFVLFRINVGDKTQKIPTSPLSKVIT